MIISMSDVIFVTNRKLCREDFLTRIERLAQSCPKAVILREKDLSPEEYTRLAAKVMEICRARGTLCILHTFADTAEKLHAAALHLSMDGLRKLDHRQRKKLSVLGASCHSAAEASEAEALGCTYITAGHIFNTCLLYTSWMMAKLFPADKKANICHENMLFRPKIWPHVGFLLRFAFFR